MIYIIIIPEDFVETLEFVYFENIDVVDNCSMEFSTTFTVFPV